MTVSTTSNRISYTGNGSTTVFAFPYKFIATSDIKVYVAGVLQTTGYSVGTPTDSGANVTFTSAPASNASIVLLSDPARLQSTALPSTGPFPAKSVETALDKLTLLVQRVYDLTSRSLTLNDGDATSISTTLPAPVASQLIGWNSQGTGLATVDPASVLTIAGSSGFTTNTFNGDGATTTFTLTANPGIIANVDAFIAGLRQRPSVDYTLNGSFLTFVTAPPAGSSNILIKWGTTFGVGVPTNGSVTTPILADNSVTTAKVVDAQITPAKLTSDFGSWVTAASAALARTALGLTSAATATIGTAAGNLIALNGSAQLPAVDGSLLTGVGGSPSGSMMPYAGASTPTGWLLADGSAVSRTTYANLFTAIGTNWGNGDGSTTFNLPDMRNRVPVGSGTVTISESVLSTSVSVAADTFTVNSNASPKTKWATGMPVVVTTTGTLPTGIAAATTYYVIRVSSTTIQLATTLANALAATQVNITAQGSGTHTITSTLTTKTLGELFGVEMSGDIPAHNHAYTSLNIAYGSGGSGGTNGANLTGSGGSQTSSTAAVMSFAGISEAISNMQPSAVVNYIIKT